MSMMLCGLMSNLLWLGSEIYVFVVFTSVFTIFAGKKKAAAINLVSNDNFPTCWVRAIELGRPLPQKIFLLLVASQAAQSRKGQCRLYIV